MFVLCFFLIFVGILYLNSQNHFDAQELLENATYIVFFSIVIAGIFMFLGNEPSDTSLYHLIFAFIFASIIYYIKQKTKQKPLAIVANQQRYFSEVKASDIYKFYDVRRSIKRNRVEVLVNKENKKLLKNNLIVPSFFLDFQSLEPTKIMSIKELEDSKIFSVIFKKLQGFIGDLEAKVNYEKVLEENGNYAEFFLMDLWEQYTYKFNIGVSNLEILCTNAKEKEFLGALDLLNLNCVKRKGAVFYYKFIAHKGRPQDFIRESKDITPKEQGFDEKYALENDSDRTCYKG